MNRIYSIYNSIEKITVASQRMNDYINSLSKNDYALLAAVFILGRSGWERDYEDTDEYHIFMEDKASEGVHVSQQILDDKFLSKDNKKRQFDIIHEFTKSDTSKVDDIYKHNWLSQKTNLMSEVKKGLAMLEEIAG